MENLIESIDARVRKLNEIALECGKSRRSDQTGYLHYCYHPGDSEEHMTIPVKENVLYAYALLKSKTADNMQEGKRILGALLKFQNASGNFPIYLHEYPDCKDLFLAFYLLLPLSFILKQFESILGEELKGQLQQAYENCWKFCLKISEEKKIPLFLRRILSDDNRVAFDVFDPKEFGFLLTYEQLKTVPSSFLKKRAIDWYDPLTGSFVGPAFKIYQNEYDPEVTLLDYHYAAMSGYFPRRLLKSDIVQLQACLVQPYHEEFILNQSKEVNFGYLESYKYQTLRRGNCCLSSIEIPLNKEDPDWKGISPFRMVWGDFFNQYSLVAQGGNYQTIEAQFDKNQVEVNYLLEGCPSLDKKEEQRELVFSLSYLEDVKITIDGVKATTFSLKDVVKIYSKKINFSLSFSLIEGDGEFLGHIMPGNRVSQLALKNENRFNAYDWQIFLRTLRRSGRCKVRVKIVITEVA